MAYPQGIRGGVWGLIASFFPFSVMFLSLTILEYKFSVPISESTYKEMLFIPVFIGFIIGVITGCVYDYKFDKIKKNVSNEEIKRIYNKEVFYCSIVTFVSIALFIITCYVYISSKI